MAKLNWSPWLGLTEVKAELDRIIAQSARGGGPADLPEKAYFWTPAADVLETVDAYLISVELPGVEREEVALEIRTRTLWVYGERRFVNGPEREGEFISLERSYGPFARRFALPKGVDRGGVGAVLKHGLLLITIPKERQESRCRRIVIL